MDERTFSALWAGLVKGTTMAVYVLLFSLAILFIFVLDNVLLVFSLIVLFGSILLLPYLWSPRGYVLNGREVVVKRLIGGLKIRFSGEPRRWRWTWRGLRLFGSGGLYGYFGLFIFKGTGRVWMHATVKLREMCHSLLRYG